MQIISVINPENISDKDADNFEIKRTARAVVYDSENKIGILYVGKNLYHKLPGGGVEEGESIKMAVERECKEELGCNIEINREIGRTIELKGERKVKQISECFVARVVGQKGTPSFTQKEINNKFSVLWIDLDEAVDLLKSDTAANYSGKFALVRDLAFLEEVGRHI